ncbi:MBL fold metallo-hydrolase [Patescibacteria group bacterium]|nr:MBL fold metallo-hydrolase [Patescibacteria group bacterium]MBU1922556.1 MBL fold metallo-hydrolase [Patescibacteria group bacterium]
MKITFLGAAGEVTGSCYLVEAAHKKFLVECGMFQGERYSDLRNHEPFDFDPTEIDWLVLTHAHMDHTGRVPKLVKEGFRGPIYASVPTCRLCEIMWQDSVHVMKMNLEKYGHETLYHEPDVKRAVNLFNPVELRRVIEPEDGVFIEFFDAGHIFGSSFVRIKAEGKTIIFSGDIGSDNVPIIKDTMPRPECDFMLLESTYGDRLHEPAAGRAKMLKEILTKTIKRGGVLMIPAFSIERTQEILYELNTMVENKQIPSVPIFLDSPLAIRAIDVYREYIRYYDFEALGLVKSGDDIFDFPNFHETLSVDESKTINGVDAPKIIIAGSGMMNGGRIQHHLEKYLSDEKNCLLIVAYQAHGTLGRRMKEGAKTVEIFHHPVAVKAEVTSLDAYSAHGDQEKLISWTKRSSSLPEKIFCVHGDEAAARALSARIRDELGSEAMVPTYKQTIEL